MLEPLGFFDFVQLERHARGVLSDSGTVQEECCIFGVPNVTLRDVTERPETLECGSNIVVGSDPELAGAALAAAVRRAAPWRAPADTRDRRRENRRQRPARLSAAAAVEHGQCSGAVAGLSA